MKQYYDDVLENYIFSHHINSSYQYIGVVGTVEDINQYSLSLTTAVGVNYMVSNKILFNISPAFLYRIGSRFDYHSAGLKIGLDYQF